MNKVLMLILTCASTALLTSATIAQVQPAEVCEKAALSNFTFSVVSEQTTEATEKLHVIDMADDGKVNFDSRNYLALLEDLPSVSPEKMERKTYVVHTWFPLEYIEGKEVGKIRVFLRQEALVDPDGRTTNDAPDGAVVYLPKLGSATSAPEAARILTGHVCSVRAKLHGAEST